MKKYTCPGCNGIVRLKKSVPGDNPSASQNSKNPKPAVDLSPENQGDGARQQENRQSDRDEPLLGEYIPEKWTEYEEGEAGPEDLEWTRYADPTHKRTKLDESTIDLDDLPGEIPKLKETLADLHQAEIYNLQGENHLDRNLHRQALRDFNHALKINPAYLDALINRGRTYVILGRYEKALEDFNRALELDRHDAEIYNVRGEIYLLKQMHDQAIKDFTSAIVLNPVYSDAYLNRGRAYSEKGLKAEATADFNQAVRVDYKQLKDLDLLDSSPMDFDEENYRNKNLAAKFIQQGLKHLKTQAFKEAVEKFTTVISLLPQDSKGYIYRGLAYMKLARPNEALADFNKAALLDPLDARIYYQRGLVWKALDNRANMTKDLKLSCELGYEPACAAYRK